MTGILVDSNILLDIFEDDQHWAEWSLSQLEKLSDHNELIINPVIYSEISIGFDRLELLESTQKNTGFIFEQIPKEALFLAGKVFMQYRRKGGIKRSPLPDFYIGAHAAVRKYSLLTRDLKRYKNYFPTLQIMAP